MNRTCVTLSILFLALNSSCGKNNQSKKEKLPNENSRQQNDVSGTDDGFLQPDLLADSCSADVIKYCKTLASDIKDLRKSQEQSYEKKDNFAFPMIGLDLYYKLRLLKLYSEGASANAQLVRDLQEKYDSYKETMEKQKDLFISKPYSVEELEAVLEVFRDFGHLYIRPSLLDARNLPINSSVTMGGSRPWSSYWYPKREKHLFDGTNSPLAKFDQLLTQSGRPAQTVEIEKKQYDQGFAEWEGLCDAWAMASLMTNEPIEPITVKEISFSISDLKALTIKLYEGSKATIYGKRYLGDYRTDGKIQDLRPEAFHKLVEEVIGKQKKGLIVDTDSGPEIWANPLFQMTWFIKKDPQIENAYIVSAWPKFVMLRHTIDNTLTNELDVKLIKYEYRLYVDPHQLNDMGAYKVIYGEWMNGSLESHPDMVFLPSQQLAPHNKSLVDNRDILEDLLRNAKVLQPQ